MHHKPSKKKAYPKENNPTQNYLKIHHTSNEMFIRQSLYSDYCAVYSTGMALSIVGIQTDRRSALSLFNVKRGWKGASHDDIDAALIRATGNKGSAWRCTNESLSGAQALSWLNNQFQSISSPIIVTASCRLVQHNIICGHTFLVVGKSNASIHVLDPLTKAPPKSQQHNIEITEMVCSKNTIHPKNCRWEIISKHPIYCKEIIPSPVKSNLQNNPKACYELPAAASTAAALGSIRMAKTTKCKLAST